MNFILFGSYLTLLVWLVIKTPFFKKLAMPVWMLAGLFLLKVWAGIYYGWFFTHMPNYKLQADTWRLYYESLVETDWLKNDPVGFIADLFTPRYQNTADGSVLSTSHSYWNDIKSVLVVKLMALCNLLSGGRYYINVLFFEYLSFFGPVALSRLFIYYFPEKKGYLIAGAFLFPSTLLWCSGFHKEGLLLTSLAMATWIVHRWLQKEARFFPGVIFIALHLFTVFLLRNYLALFFILWCIPLILSHRYLRYSFIAFCLTTFAAVVLFFTTSSIKLLPDLPQKLAIRQQEFLRISGESLIQPNQLQPGLQGYSKALPDAVINGFLQPLPVSVKKWSYLPAIAEIIIFVLLLLNAIYRLAKNKRWKKIKLRTGIPIILFCGFFCTSVFLLIGYTIPYLGAIVRYKSVVWPFITLPLAVLIPNKKVYIINKIMRY